MSRESLLGGKPLGSALMGAEGQGRDRKGGLKRGSAAPDEMGLDCSEGLPAAHLLSEVSVPPGSLSH